MRRGRGAREAQSGCITVRPAGRESCPACPSTSFSQRKLARRGGALPSRPTQAPLTSFSTVPIRASQLVAIPQPDAPPNTLAMAANPLAGAELPVTRVPQRCLNWCWAACAEMVLRYKKVTSTQCEIATRALRTASCCPDGLQSGCNVMIPVNTPVGSTPDIAGVYRLFNVSATYRRQPLVPNEIASEIAALRPVQAYLARGGSRGHVVLIIGFQPSGDADDPWVLVIDPEPTATKQGKVRYSELHAGLGSGLWDGVIFRIGA